MLKWLQKHRSRLSPTPLMQEKTVPGGGTPDRGVSPAIFHSSKRASDAATFTIATTANDILRVEEVTDAEFYIGDLFRRRFAQDPPHYLRHFVAFYRPSLKTYQAA